MVFIWFLLVFFLYILLFSFAFLSFYDVLHFGIVFLLFSGDNKRSKLKKDKKWIKCGKRQRIRILHTKTKGLLRPPVMAITDRNRHDPQPFTKASRYIYQRPITNHNRKASFFSICFLFWPNSICFKTFDYLDSILCCF